jgi:hypothetical protein
MTQGSKNHLVSIYYLDLKWLIGNKEGYKFLKNILSSENDEIYNNQSMKCLIHFLFKTYKK